MGGKVSRPSKRLAFRVPPSDGTLFIFFSVTGLLALPGHLLGRILEMLGYKPSVYRLENEAKEKWLLV